VISKVVNGDLIEMDLDSPDSGDTIVRMSPLLTTFRIIMKVKGLKCELSVVPEDLVFQNMGTACLIRRILTRLYVQIKCWQVVPLPSSPCKRAHGKRPAITILYDKFFALSNLSAIHIFQVLKLQLMLTMSEGSDSGCNKHSTTL